MVRDRLSQDDTKKWAESALRILRDAFPYEIDDIQTWSLSRIVLPHALAAVAHAEELMVATEETGDILNLTGLYLMDHAEFSKRVSEYSFVNSFVNRSIKHVLSVV